MTRKKAYVLKFDYSFFGRVIPKGTVYREKKGGDWYIPDILDRGILMHCPGLVLHFTTIMKQDYFIEIYD